MKAKLIKRSNGRFDLYKIEDVNQLNTIASSFDNSKGKLSLKNCQAIENGYDLDELAETFAKNHSIYPTAQDDTEYGFKNGFQKALEILGDKKFTENNIDEAFDAGYEMLDSPKNYNDVLKEFKESLEPTEWDVEIETEEREVLVNGYKNQPPNIIGFIADYEMREFPKLDENECLILKMI